MSPQKPGTTGRFVTQALVRPAIDIDCSTWSTTDPADQWTTGRFVKTPLVRPAFEVDCSEWPEPPTLFLELTLHPKPPLDALELAFGLFDVLKAVNKLDCLLGGTGLTNGTGQQINGMVMMALVPEQQTGAVERVRQICEQVNRESPTHPPFPLPVFVKTIRARLV